MFQLDIFTGELTALIDLDYESRSEYVIVVQATSAPLVSRATVHIKLVDKNDNVPVLKNFQIIFNNYVTDKSSSFPSGVIGRIPAHDPDVSDQLHYSFEVGNELNLVILNQSTGEIQLSPDLDNNRPLEASMTISVTGEMLPLMFTFLHINYMLYVVPKFDYVGCFHEKLYFPDVVFFLSNDLANT